MQRNIISLIAIGAMASLSACGDDDPAPIASNTIVDVAVANGNFDTLVGALQTTGLDATLQGEGPFTVFAPTDAAFDLLPDGVLASLDSQTLSDILTYHVVAGAVDSTAVVGLDAAPTVQGGDVSVFVDGGTVVLDGLVQVTTTDIEADNGIIHVIDSVLLPIDFPGDIVAALSAYPRFESLVGAVSDAGLVSTLQSPNADPSRDDGWSVFAPANSAFAALGDISGLTDQQLADVLLYHVVDGPVPAETVVTLDQATTRNGIIDIAVQNGGVVLNGNVNVTRTDVMTTNGIIHVIDAVLQ